MKRLLVAGSVLAAAVACLGAASALAGKPTLAFNETSWTSPAVQPGGTSSLEAALTFTGKSSGTLTVGLSANSSSAFVITTNNCNGKILANNDTCTVLLDYRAPSSYSQTDTGALIATAKGKLKATMALTGSTVAPPLNCTAGSEDFSGFDDFELTFDFSGGRIYVPFENVYTGIRVEPDSWGSGGQFPSGTHLYFTGIGANSAELTFDVAVGSVQLDTQANYSLSATTETLTAYDASDSVIDTDSATSLLLKNTLTVTSTSNNIKSFTIATNHPEERGLVFTNISWTCN